MEEQSHQRTGEDYQSGGGNAGDEEGVAQRPHCGVVETFVVSGRGEPGQERERGHACGLGDDTDRHHVELTGEAERGGGAVLYLPEPSDELLVEHCDRLSQHQRQGEYQVLLHRWLVSWDRGEPGPGGAGAEPLQPEVAHRRADHGAPEEGLRRGRAGRGADETSGDDRHVVHQWRQGRVEETAVGVLDRHQQCPQHQEHLGRKYQPGQ